MFSAEIYIERRKHLRADVGSGIILLFGNEESPMNYTDNQYPFRQDSSFLYFFGHDYPGLAAVIDINQGTECMFGDDLTVDDRHVLLCRDAGALRREATRHGCSQSAKATVALQPGAAVPICLFDPSACELPATRGSP